MDEGDRGRGIAQAANNVIQQFGDSEEQEEDGGNFWNLTAKAQNISLDVGLRRASPHLQSADDLLKRFATHESTQHPMVPQESSFEVQDDLGHVKPKRCVTFFFFYL